MKVELPDWAECLFQENIRHYALKGGRGGAKSRSIATALVIRASAKPLRVLCTRETQRSIRDSVKRLLDDEIQRMGLGHFFTSTDSEIRGANGSLFIFAGLRTNIDAIKSMEGIDVCWVEEAQTISQNSIDILIPTIRKPDSCFYWAWNPKLETDPVERMFCGPSGAPPRSVVRTVNFTHNPWFPSTLREEMEYDRAKNPDKYAHIWLGEYQKNSHARVLTNWKVEEFEAPPEALHRLGADFGFAVDPTIAIRCHIVGRRIYVDYEAHALKCEVLDTPDLFMSIPDAEKWPMTADSARPETISHLKKHGFPKIMPAVKGANSIAEGIEFLKSYEIIVHPRCTHVIDGLTLYSYKVDPLTKQVLPVLDDANADVPDTLRYALESVRRAEKQQKPQRTVVPLPISHKW